MLLPASVAALSLVSSSCGALPTLISSPVASRLCLFILTAGKSKPVEVTASEAAADKAPVGPTKAKAKKVPRYVKEALKEVEQEKASRIAAVAQISQKPDQQKVKAALPAAAAAAAGKSSRYKAIAPA